MLAAAVPAGEPSGTAIAVQDHDVLQRSLLEHVGKLLGA
jgi:hypothetical protein